MTDCDVPFNRTNSQSSLSHLTLYSHNITTIKNCFCLLTIKPVRPIKRTLLEPSLFLTESHSFFQFNFNHEQDIYRRIGWY